MSEWKETTLTDLCTDISYGYTESAKTEKIGPKFLRITDIANGRINWDNVPYCPISDTDFNKYKLFPGDIVVARTGATTGSNYTLKEDDPDDVVFASYLIRYKINRKTAYPFFIGHILQSTNWQDFVDAIAGGSAQPGANAKQLGSFEILLPPLPEQKAIAGVLSSLDDKIDLLHRQNKTLEAMAEALFRQWFVEPCKDGLPEGWRETALENIATVKSGTTPSTKRQEYWDGDIYWTTPKDITNLNGIFLFNTGRKITELGLKQISSGLLPTGSLLMTSRAPVGVLAFAEIPVAINQGYAGIICNKGFSREFLYLWLKMNMDYVQSHANGSTFQEISKSSFKSLIVQIAPLEIQNTFNCLINPLFIKIRNSTKHIHNLMQLRDALLPKFLSGDVMIVI